MKQRCPLCRRAIAADVHAMKQHLFSAAHANGEEVIAALEAYAEADDGYYVLTPEFATAMARGEVG